jgi:hypothetical protein
MAYNSQNLSVLAYANGFTLWHYKTTDAAVDVDNTGYFNSAVLMLRVGDFILANCSTGGTPENGLFVVRSNTGSAVDVANMNTFGTANSD